ncbi:DNA polymerase III subunit gamma/tau [Aquibacillus sp. 3ASR75-11]|uniref:DNA-directed DNA polymerase n=1 Tax=Terrihalobacillus insolitus TaxID=2950438 RepID=A0A9X3WZU5_9BACI|nr:DNA polymerase III subunit gamma/tau [Terrihalobacillus insolitus]MDC3415248.1 DNA polymerase III subunit gamma/tau [Terrihalobacillus insolitus]MDC3426319.1 DNA polymerase III subunit gamma/tau [Terrihalobacillus insolitus]
MSYQALYRVWRPNNFSDVVGQSHITRTLKNAIVQEKFSHAYLFSGPRGTGKTSAAKIFAKTINCEHSPVEESCNECSACIGIQDGSISDVMEIDAASNNGVEQIRDIRDKVKYAPSAVKYKVYIIDEVHMLSIGAFNALLKTLEEPPKHVIFILATTEPHKIPLTIISRCQRFDFKRISPKAIVERMQTILEVEGISVTKDALEAVALSAEGGMRDALSLLDQAISYSEDQVMLEDVLAVTGSVSQEKLAYMVEAIYQNDVQQALLTLDELMNEGKDPGRFVFDLIYYLRDLLLYQSAPALGNMLERAILSESFKRLSKEVPASWLQQAIAKLNQCQQEIKWTNSPKVFIEIAILNMVEMKQQTSQPTVEDSAVQSLIDKVELLEKKIHSYQQTTSIPETTKRQADVQRKPSRGIKNNYKIPYERIRIVLGEASKEQLKNIQAQWPNFMDALKQKNAPAHATVLNSKPRAASEQALVVAFKYEIHCSLALDHKETIESLLTELVGKSLTILPIPEQNWQELRAEYVHKQREQEDNDRGHQAIQEEPVIEEARKLFGDDLLEIHD